MERPTSELFESDAVSMKGSHASHEGTSCASAQPGRDGYFAIVSDGGVACNVTASFAGGQLRTRAANASVPPSLDNLMVCGSRPPSAAGDVSVSSICG